MTEENIESELEKIKEDLPKKPDKLAPPRKLTAAQRQLHNLEAGIIITVLSVAGGWGLYDAFTDTPPQKQGTQLEERIYNKDQKTAPSKKLENRISEEERYNINKKAFEYLSVGEFISAYQILKPAIEQYPNNAIMLNNYATALDGIGRFQEAINVYRKSIELKPDNPSTFSNLGITYLKLGDKREARKWFDKTLEKDSKYTKAMVNIGYLYYEEEKHKTAIKWYNKAISIDNNHYYAWYNKSLAQSKLGYFKDAKKSVDNALRIRPESEYASIQKKYLDRALAD